MVNRIFLSRLSSPKTWICIWALLLMAFFAIGLQPARAKNYEISGSLEIPSINLTSDVTTLKFENGELNPPDSIVGSFSGGKNKTLLIAHSTTAFKDLHQVDFDQKITYNDTIYNIYSIETLPKASVNMRELLSSADKPTLVLMTCAGELYGNGDASERLIIKAEAI